MDQTLGPGTELNPSSTAQVFRLRHPLVEHHLCEIRDARTRPGAFRLAIGRLAMLLGVRATEDLPTQSVSIRTPLADADCQHLSVRIGIVPILRAGLGMVDPLLVLLPDAEVWHLGLYRNEETAEPISYYDKLPTGGAPDVVMLLDPMLATGGSIVLAIQRLIQWGVKDIRVVSIIASQPGIDRVSGMFKDVRIYVATIDPILDQRSYIVPGLGDAGDRIFDTQRNEQS
ncbi:MAG TPA: uracil phosphoribosyltransferase [Planctomycetaceae bacterium]|nr:uracil phosphoribosyltransferase [Planctomycetaceae bacterium]